MSKYKFVEHKKEDSNISLNFWKMCGKIFIGCGVAWLIIVAFISMMPQDYEKYDVSLFFSIFIGIGAVSIIIGSVILFLLKKSKKFREVLDMSMISYAERKIEKDIKKENTKSKMCVLRK